MVNPLGLSDQALSLLQSHLAAIGLRNGGASGTPTDETREAYRELASAGLMGACSTFARGPESVYKLTEEAYSGETNCWRFNALASSPRRRPAESFEPSR